MYNPISLNDEIFINQFSQCLHTLEDMNRWFNEKSIIKKREIIFGLLNMVIQSHPTYEEIESAAKTIKKITSVSAVKLLNKNKPYNKFGYEICELPEKELIVGFDILLLTLAISDNRRKSSENPNECNHWWHKDLSNLEYLESLRIHNN